MPLTLVVDMRNVSVADARNRRRQRRARLPACRLEQATAVDGRALARVHVALAQAVEYTVRSARNTIRLELKRRGRRAGDPRLPPKPATRAAAQPPALAVDAAPQPAQPRDRRRQPPVKSASRPRSRAVDAGHRRAATIIERIASSKTPGATTVTLGGNGRLTPAGVTESKDRPRRLVLDFPNVDVEGADADGDRQPARDARARRR